MENDSEEKFLKDWNARYASPSSHKHPYIVSNFDEAYGVIETIANERGSGERIKRYEYYDNINDLKITQLLKKLRKETQKEILVFWERAKALRKQSSK